MTKRQYAGIFRYYLCLISGFLLYVGIDAMRQRDRWSMGDWITNYAGGFVRRGLIGELAIDLSRAPLHTSPYFWVFCLQMMCYAVIFGSVLYLLHGLAWKFWMMAMVYSPATLSFTLFDPTFAFRKEILFLAGLAGLIVALSMEVIVPLYLSVLVAAGTIALTLSHEGMLFYYPYIVCALLIAYKDIQKALIVSIPGVLGGVCAFIAASRHIGNLRTASAICSSIGEHALTAGPCSGAIIYMTRTAPAARSDVINAISYWHLKLLMPFLLIMALTPMTIGVVELWKRKDDRFAWWSLLICSGIAWLSTVGLFVYGFDWNRWIYVHVFSALLLMLLIERSRQRSLVEEQQAIFSDSGRYRYGPIAAFILFSCTWQLGFYHHFPLPGEQLILYMEKRISGKPLHQPSLGLPE